METLELLTRSVARHFNCDPRVAGVCIQAIGAEWQVQVIRYPDGIHKEHRVAFGYRSTCIETALLACLKHLPEQLHT